MKSRFISSLITFIALVFSATVMADDYPLYVGGKQVTGGETTFNVTADGKIKYDPASRTLTLRDAVIRDTVCAIHNAGIDSLVILVEGTDSIITTGADGLLLERNTFIRSESHEGLLCINVNKKNGQTRGIPAFGQTQGIPAFGQTRGIPAFGQTRGIPAFGQTRGSAPTEVNKKDSIADYAALRVGGGSTVAVSDCYMKMVSEGWAVKGDSLETLAIVTAEVSAQTRDTLRSCIEGFRNMTLRSVIPDGGKAYNAITMSLCQSLNSTKKVQQVLIQGSLYLGRYMVDVMLTDTVQTIAHASTGLKKGRIRYDARLHTLTLDSAVVQTTGYPAIRNVSMQFLTIAVLGPNTVSSTGSDALSLLTSTTISGVENSGEKLVVKGNAGGIYQGGHEIYGYTLTLSGVTMEVDAATRGIYGDGKYSLFLIDNARVKVFTSSAGGTFKAISAFAGCTMRNADCANGVAWRQATGNFDRNDGTTAGEVVIDVPTVFYPVTILGHSLNNVNSADIAIDGMTGTGSASYNADTKTLSLSETDIRLANSSGYYFPAAVSLTEPGYTIYVSGTNSISYDCGISATYGGTLTGPGTLNIVGTEGPAIATGSKDMFTVSCAVLNAKGNDYGFDAASGGGLTLAVAAGQTATTHTFSGNNGNIRTSELTLSDMNFYQPVCCYFDPNVQCIMQNGGRVVNEEVTFRQVTQRYGVKIMGVEIDNCNATGVGTPLISTTNFMNFNEATNTLTLDNFSLDTDAEMNMIESERDGLQIVVKGTCIFNTKASAFFKVNNPNTKGRVDNTFRGDGTLDVKARFFTMLVGKRSGLTFTDNVTVTGEGAISGNSLGTAEEKLTVEENAKIACKGPDNSPAVEQFAQITISGDIRVVEPNWGSIKQMDNGYAIVNRQGEKYTGKVVIGKPESLGMYVGEDAVTTANYSDIDGRGHFIYDPDKKILTLNNATLIDTTGINGSGISNRAVDGLSIRIVGNNNLKVRNNVIYSEKGFTIDGGGTLNGISTESKALSLFGADCVIRGTQINLTGKTYAIQGTKQTEKLMVYDTSSQITLNTKGRSTVSGLGALTLQAGLYITEPFNAEFDNNYGGIAVGGLLYNGTVVISNREPSAITPTTADSDQKPVEMYDFGGRKTANGKSKGLYLVRMSDGTVRKQIQK
jgi:hypothetical protein